MKVCCSSLSHHEKLQIYLHGLGEGEGGGGGGGGGSVVGMELVSGKGPYSFMCMQSKGVCIQV